MKRARRPETLEREYWEKHPRELAARLAPTRRYRDRCRKRLRAIASLVGDVILNFFICSCAVCCCYPHACGDISTPETPRTPSPPPTPHMKPVQISAMTPIPLECGLEPLQPHNHGTLETDVQIASPLLRLPREVRDIIWESVLSGHVIHVGWSPRRLHHTMCNRCKFSDFQDGPSDTCWPYSLEPSLHRGRREYAQKITEPSKNLLGLVKSCRTIHKETLDWIYSRNVFSFNSWNCLRWFSETIPPYQRNLIRRVWLRWDLSYDSYTAGSVHFFWDAAAVVCKTLATMENLHELHVKLNNDNSYGPIPEPEARLALFQPINNVQNFRIFGPFWEASEEEDAAPYDLYSLRHVLLNGRRRGY